MVNTHSLILALTHRLFEAETRRLDGRVAALTTQNKRLTEARFDGFIHAGKLYLSKKATTRGSMRSSPALHVSLHDEMDSYLRDEMAIHVECKLISQILFNLLSPCTDDQDVRNTLPECLIGYLPELSGLRRTGEEAFTIKDNPRALQQYLKILPKIEVYSVTQLIY